MARFVDRRTSALMRGLRVREDMLAGVAADGTVTVEGHYVGRLRGGELRAAQGGSVLEEKALRAAAEAAVAPEIARRLGGWPPSRTRPSPYRPTASCSGAARRRAPSAAAAPSRRKVRLYGDLGPSVARERAGRRLEAFVAAEAAGAWAPCGGWSSPSARAV
jgi:ATP-dependent RNA helicase SUPV3L1/SUV3